MRNLLSDNGFVWLLGVVEDRNDPSQLGRFRVRCFGFHTDDKGQIPTEELPWAVPLQDVTSAAINGIGRSPTGLVEGSWVVGFFLDGERAQEPVIMGSIATAPSEYGEYYIRSGVNDLMKNLDIREGFQNNRSHLSIILILCICLLFYLVLKE